MCFAEFLRWYYLKRELVRNDNLPVELTDPDIENNHFPSTNYPKVIPLMSSKDKQQCRKVQFVLRYHVPSKEKYSEKYSYRLLHLFYPFRDEMELKGKYLGTYKEKISEPGVGDLVNANKLLIKLYGDLADAVFAHFQDKEMNYNIDSHGQRKSEDSIDHSEKIKQSNTIGETDARYNIDFTITTSDLENLRTNDDDVNDRILNTKQRYIFDYVHKWARDYVKN